MNWEGLNAILKRLGVGSAVVLDVETAGFTSQTLGGAGQRGLHLLSPGATMVAQAAQPYPTMIGLEWITRGGQPRDFLGHILAGQTITNEAFYRAQGIKPVQLSQALLAGVRGGRLRAGEAVQLLREFQQAGGITATGWQQLNKIAGISVGNVGYLSKQQYHSLLGGVAKAPLIIGYNIENFDVRYLHAFGHNPPVLDIYPIQRRILQRVLPKSFWDKFPTGGMKQDVFVNEIVGNFAQYEAELDPKVAVALKSSFGPWLNKPQNMHNPLTDAQATARITDFIGRLIGARPDLNALFESQLQLGLKGLKGLSPLLAVGARGKLFGTAKYPFLGEQEALKTIQKFYGKAYTAKFRDFWSFMQSRMGGKGQLVVSELGGIWAGFKGIPESFIPIPGQRLTGSIETALVTMGNKLNFARRLQYYEGGQLKLVSAAEAFFSAFKQRAGTQLAFGETTAAGMLPALHKQAMRTTLRAKSGTLEALTLGDVLSAESVGMLSKARLARGALYKYSAYAVENPTLWGRQIDVLQSTSPLLEKYYAAGQAMESMYLHMRGPKAGEAIPLINEYLTSIEQELRRQGVATTSGTVKAEQVLKGVVPLPGAERLLIGAATKRAKEKGIYQATNVSLLTKEAWEFIKKAPGLGPVALPNPLDKALGRAIKTSLLRRRMATAAEAAGQRISSTTFGIPLLVMETSMRELGDTGARFFGNVYPAFARPSVFPTIEATTSKLEGIQKLLGQFLSPEEIESTIVEALGSGGAVSVGGKIGSRRSLLRAFKTAGLRVPEAVYGLTKNVRLRNINLSQYGGRYSLKLWLESPTPQIPRHPALILGGMGRVQPTGAMALESKALGLVVGVDVFQSSNPLYIEASHLAAMLEQSGHKVPPLTGSMDMKKYVRKLRDTLAKHDPQVQIEGGFTYKNRTAVRALDILRGLELEHLAAPTSTGYKPLKSLLPSASGRLFFRAPIALRPDISVGAVGRGASASGITITQAHQLRSAASLLGFERAEDYLPFKIVSTALRKKGIELGEGPRIRLLQHGIGGDVHALLAAIGHSPDTLPRHLRGRLYSAAERPGYVKAGVGKEALYVPTAQELAMGFTPEAESKTIIKALREGTVYLPLPKPVLLPTAEQTGKTIYRKIHMLALPSAAMAGLPPPGEPLVAGFGSYLGAGLELYRASLSGSDAEIRQAAARYSEAIRQYFGGKEGRFSTDVLMTALPGSGETSIAALTRTEEQQLAKRLGTKNLYFERFMRARDIKAYIKGHRDPKVRRYLRRMLREEGYVPMLERASPAQRPLYFTVTRLRESERYADIIDVAKFTGAANERTMWMSSIAQLTVDRDNDADKTFAAVLGVREKKETQAALDIIRRQESTLSEHMRTLGELLLSEKTTISEALKKAQELPLEEVSSLVTMVSTKLTAHAGYAARSRLFMGQLGLSGNTMEQAFQRLGGGGWTRDALEPLWEFGKETAEKNLLYAEEALKVFYQVFVKKAGKNKDKLLESLGQLHKMSSRRFASTEEAIAEASRILTEGFNLQGGITKDILAEVGMKPMAIGAEAGATAEKLLLTARDRLAWLFGVSARMLHGMRRATPPPGTLEYFRGAVPQELESLFEVTSMHIPKESLVTIFKDTQEVVAESAPSVQTPAARLLPRATEVLKNVIEHPVTKIAMLAGGGLAVYNVLFGGESEEAPPPIPIPRTLQHDSPTLPRDPMLGGQQMNLPMIQPPMGQPAAYLTPVTSPAPSISLDARTNRLDNAAFLSQSVASLGPQNLGTNISVRFKDDRETMNPYKMNQMLRSYSDSRWVT